MNLRMRLATASALLATLASFGFNALTAGAANQPARSASPIAATAAASANKPTLRLPAGAQPCPSKPGKPSSPLATCSPGTAGDPNAVPKVSRPAGRPACPIVPGKAPSSPEASCGTDAILPNGVAGPMTITLPAGSTPCPTVIGKVPSPVPAACGNEVLPDTAGGPDVLKNPPGLAPCPPPPPGKHADGNASCGHTGSPTGQATSEVIPTLPNAINGWTITAYANPNALAPGVATNIHAVANMDVGPTPYYIEIFDSTSGQFLNYCYTGATCDSYPSQSSPTTHTFTAYVSYYGNPPGYVQASSSVNVTWLSVSLSRSTCCIGTGGTITVTATANTNVGPTPWYIEIFDYYSHGRVTYCYTGSSCSYNVSSGSAGSRTFIAFVSGLYTNYPPTSTQATSGAVTVTWVVVSLSASPQYMSAGGTTTLTATANADISASPYYIEIYNASNHTYLFNCATGSVCRWNVSYGTATAQNYVAYISRSGITWPPPDVQALSNTVYVAWYTITLSAGGAPYVRPGDFVALSAYATPDVGATISEYIEIYEQKPGGYLTYCGAGGNCVFNYYGTVGTHNFVAYVSNLDTSNNYPPGGAVASSNGVSATWLSVTISANRTSLPDGATTTLTAQANTTLSGAHESLDIYEAGSGFQLASCQNCSTATATRSYSTAQSQGYYAAIITDLSGGSVQATSSTVGVTWFRWGVDSCDRVTDDYNAVVSALGKPEFWGRYIGSTSFACNVTAADASFAHSNGVAILPVYAEDGSAAFTSQAAGQQAATWAVDAAHNLGIPGGTVIMLDAEPSYGVVAGSLQGWADSIAVSGYKPGFYEYSGNPFASAFCTAASDPNVANALLWTTQPNVQPHGHRALSAAPAFGPSPTCGYGASALQYFTQDPNNVIPPNVDDDEALASIPLW